jgi:hypothetical protein
MASPRDLFQYSDTPLLKQNALDGGLHLLMLRRSSRRIAPRVSFELNSAANK